MYKAVGLLVLVALGLATFGCSSSSNGSGSNNINGTWSATLTNMDGTPAYQFTTNFTEQSGGGLSVTSFTFTSAGPCFGSYSSNQYTETGSFGLAGNFNGQVNGTFGMNITTIFPSTTNNVLTLQGTVSGNKITGTWSATGLSGCTGNGNFTATAG